MLVSKAGEERKAWNVSNQTDPKRGGKRHSASVPTTNLDELDIHISLYTPVSECVGFNLVITLASLLR
jgi:hypothetical protein